MIITAQRGHRLLRCTTRALILILIFMVTSAEVANAQTNALMPPFMPLFDGESLNGWHGNNPHVTARAKPADRLNVLARQKSEFSSHWRVEDGELVNDGTGPYATSNESFGDIELILDYKTVANADSGVYLRGTPQVQIWDTTEAGGKWNRNANYGSGGLFNNSPGKPGQLPLRLADRPFGEWNHFRILQIGSRTWVEMNDLLVVDGAIMENFWDKERQLPLPAQGPIQLQTHGGEIRWRNIAVRKIGVEEAISRLRGDDSKFGFQPIFNGTDLSGWKGAIDDYEVLNGALSCKSGRGGVLFTEQEYENFVVRLEFLLPPGGNNGLAIRYPGKGRAAYDGMCELQVLDDDHPKYAKLDPRQYHGSVYGISPAYRGYLRPAGQWNYQEVTVRDGNIRVELNGTVITDCNVDEIHDYKDGSAHPGKGLRKGHFGFAGHNDPVKFRNISVKRLPSSNSGRGTAEATGILRGEIFHASMDDVTDANLSTGDGFLTAAKSTKREDISFDHVGGLEIAKSQGVLGDALSFPKKLNHVHFYPGNEVQYSQENWSGTISLWMKLNPDEDLEPGYCDPLQITDKKWNDSAIFLDFDKELPRAFRLGFFSDYRYWNPDDTPWEQVASEDRPLIVVHRPPFSREAWTHVCFTWENVNAANNADATIRLYLDGKEAGTMTRPIKITWQPDKIATMIGINYIGLMDELRCFNRPLSARQVQSLYNQTLAGSLR